MQYIHTYIHTYVRTCTYCMCTYMYVHVHVSCTHMSGLYLLARYGYLITCMYIHAFCILQVKLYPYICHNYTFTSEMHGIVGASMSEVYVMSMA